MKPIERRIRNIEAALLPSGATVYLEHAEGDPEFERELTEAKARGARVLVGHPDWDVTRCEVLDGVEHMSTFTALVNFSASQPSREGRRNLFDDILHASMGRTIGPGTFAKSDHDVDDAEANPYRENFD